VVRQTGALLADAISHTYTQLHRYREEVNGAIGVKVNRINYLAQQVADLNKQIVAVTVSGDHPNDLLDARDLLVKELAQITNIQAVTDDELQMHISISGQFFSARFSCLQTGPKGRTSGLSRYLGGGPVMSKRSSMVESSRDFSSSEMTFYEMGIWQNWTGWLKH